MKKISIICLLGLLSFNSFAYSISKAGIEHIKKHEACKLTAYKDAGGYSIGWGHHHDVTPGMKITQKEADRLLEQDIKEAERYTNWLLSKLPYKHNFKQEFIDGVIDLVYNAGVGGAKNSTFYKRLKLCRVKNGVINKSDLDYTLAAYKTACCSQKGHTDRRLAAYKRIMSVY